MNREHLSTKPGIYTIGKTASTAKHIKIKTTHNQYTKSLR